VIVWQEFEKEIQLRTLTYKTSYVVYAVLTKTPH